MNRSISGYCDCFNENRDIIVEYLPVTIGRSMSKHYKKGLFNACSDCPVSNAVRTGIKEITIAFRHILTLTAHFSKVCFSVFCALME